MRDAARYSATHRPLNLVVWRGAKQMKTAKISFTFCAILRCAALLGVCNTLLTCNTQLISSISGQQRCLNPAQRDNASELLTLLAVRNPRRRI